ncbi:18490_t:CDS:1, partial [Funneliformis geosporum]
LYIELKQKLTNLKEIKEESSTPIIVEDDDIFVNMWISNQQFTQMKDDEILRYLQYP